MNENRFKNKGAFMMARDRMIVADEDHLSSVEDPRARESIREQLRVRLPVSPGHVLLKIECVGVCGSDVHFFHEGRCGSIPVDEERDIPYMLGHEAAGTVVAAGEGVTALKPGDRVCCEPGIPCGHCEYCLSGRYNLCPEISFWATPPVQGCYMRYVEFRADHCFLLPDDMSMETGAMIEPFANAMYAAETAQVKAGDSVLIMGSGCIGLMSLLACRYKGAEKIILCDLEDNRLKRALELGADHVINNGKLSEQEFFDTVRELTDGGPHVVIEAIGNKTTIRQSVELARLGGSVVWDGRPPEKDIDFSVNGLMRKELNLKAIFRYRHMYPICIKAAETCPIESVISHRYGIDDIQRAFDDSIYHKNEVVKAVVMFD